MLRQRNATSEKLALVSRDSGAASSLAPPPKVNDPEPTAAVGPWVAEVAKAPGTFCHSTNRLCQRALEATLGFALLVGVFLGAALAGPEEWRGEWPQTDFSRHSVAYDEILSGGPPKDGIPAIDRPAFVPVGQVGDLRPLEPVISVAIGKEARAYPLRILIWHEIVNDTIEGLPIAVTWCPLCNSSVVLDRRAGDRTLTFGTTGKLRYSDLVMYDRQTESWWQQNGGECIVGALLGSQLKFLPARVESFERFRARFPNGLVLLPPDQEARPYGENPYVGYDRSERPFLYRGSFPEEVAPLARVVSVGDEAWTLELVKDRRRIEAGNLIVTWEAGQNSPLDSAAIENGQDIGNVVVQRRTSHGLEDAVYDESFAFAFHAFHPRGVIHGK